MPDTERTVGYYYDQDPQSLIGRTFRWSSANMAVFNHGAGRIYRVEGVFSDGNNGHNASLKFGPAHSSQSKPIKEMRNHVEAPREAFEKQYR